jgi:hypothetical protein
MGEMNTIRKFLERDERIDYNVCNIIWKAQPLNLRGILEIMSYQLFSGEEVPLKGRDVALYFYDIHIDKSIEALRSVSFIEEINDTLFILPMGELIEVLERL